MSFNLNNPVDFARATLSLGASPLILAAAILDNLRGKNKWQIDEAAYIAITDEKNLQTNPPVRFHVFKVGDYSAGLQSAVNAGGRRKATYKFPYVDGQTTDDMGREGETYSFECIFHGANYIVGWNRLLAQLNNPRPGTLTHPVFGKIRVVPKSWRVTLQSDTRMALIVSLEFIEHNFTVAQAGTTTVDATVKGALARALAASAAIENAITKVQATASLINTVKNQIEAVLTALKTGFTGSLIQLNLSFNNSGSIDIPGALPVQAGGLSNVTGQTEAQAVAVAISPNDPFNGTLATGTEGSQTAVLTTTQAVELVNVYRAQVNEAIDEFVEAGAELEFYEEILALRETAITMQAVVEAGVKTSRPKVISYTVPRLMSMREIAFENDLSPDQMVIIDQLNPTLDSVNYIEEGTVIQVPIQA